MKSFTIVKHTPTGSTERVYTSITQAVNDHIEILNAGDTHSFSKQGAFKINTNPRSVKVLVANLNKAMCNMSATSRSTTVYTVHDF